MTEQKALTLKLEHLKGLRNQAMLRRDMNLARSIQRMIDDIKGLVEPAGDLDLN